ncbi:hypothetical protein PV326_010109, partial [Microctonus aethiopoides]
TLKKVQKRFKKACVSADIESSDNETRYIDMNPSTLSSVIERVTSLGQFLKNNQLENVSFEKIVNNDQPLLSPIREEGNDENSNENNIGGKEIENLKVFIKKEINSMKLSLQYDFNIKIGETALPIATLEGFEEFEIILGTDPDQKDALTHLYRVLVTGEKNISIAIGKLMKATLKNDVELHYSGAGRVTKNAGKKNFSATHTFSCIEDVLKELFGSSSGSIKAQIGRWFSGARDRDGKRALRGVKP